MSNAKPREPQFDGATNEPKMSPIGLYWNSMLAGIALGCHCIPFAAYDFIDDNGATGNLLFPLAPLALIVATVCIAALIVQSILVLIAFAKRSPDRHHRLCAIAFTYAAIGLIFVSGRFGWFIHV